MGWFRDYWDSRERGDRGTPRKGQRRHRKQRQRGQHSQTPETEIIRGSKQPAISIGSSISSWTNKNVGCPLLLASSLYDLWGDPYVRERGTAKDGGKETQRRFSLSLSLSAARTHP